jgi:hypothetical protein
MTDVEKRKAAVDAVARALINRVVDVEAPELWERYPDLERHDFERVVARARQITDGLAPSPAGFTAAYEHLAEQARRVADV